MPALMAPLLPMKLAMGKRDLEAYMAQSHMGAPEIEALKNQCRALADAGGSTSMQVQAIAPYFGGNFDYAYDFCAQQIILQFAAALAMPRAFAMAQPYNDRQALTRKQSLEQQQALAQIEEKLIDSMMGSAEIGEFEARLQYERFTQNVDRFVAGYISDTLDRHGGLTRN